MWKYELEYRIDKPEIKGETDKHFDLDNYKNWLEEQLTECRKQYSQSSIYSSCIECGWEGKVEDTNMDTYYDQFSDTNNSFPVCPKCGGTIRIDQQ